MQVSATLIAAQQAAREAQARFQQTHARTLQASFASALQETAKMSDVAKTEGFSALPLQQTAAEPAQPAAAPRPSSGKLGGLLDITV